MDVSTVIVATAALVSAASPVLLAIIARNQNRAARAAADKVETVRTDLAAQGQETGEKLETIHKAVNSERSLMLEKLEAMHAEVLRLTTKNTVLEETRADPQKDLSR